MIIITSHSYRLACTKCPKCSCKVLSRLSECSHEVLHTVRYAMHYLPGSLCLSEFSPHPRATTRLFPLIPSNDTFWEENTVAIWRISTVLSQSQYLLVAPCPYDSRVWLRLPTVPKGCRVHTMHASA
ncbi:unnamed protein product [Somion occarium]|uniref:Uncharacterized protein n=1 Tax=Somion occarium TaxID=3059160 RepID=A0ABP1CPX2_9APHY